jgi:Glycosyltransferase family 28 C-terminal domain
MIGYYIHHYGAGHLQMARCIAAHVRDDITGLSSLARPEDWPGEWIRLPRDDIASRPVQPTADGRLHWAPLGDVGLRTRMAVIAGWISQASPAVMMADVSVEVSLLARLMGIPAVTMVLPGRRDDPVHQLGYAVAQTLIAPWPEAIPGLADGIQPWTGKIHYVGAFSRFDGRPPPSRSAGTGKHRTVLVFQGQGGTAITERDLQAAARHTPGWIWVALGGTGAWKDDPWTDLCQADVVVTHAGLNAVAEIAAARKPAVVIPQARPHGEQTATARALASAGLAVTTQAWPEAARWPALLHAALRADDSRWQSWSPGTAAALAARLIESARHHPARQPSCASQS